MFLVANVPHAEELKTTMDYFTFWISPSLSGIVEQTHRP